MWFEQLLPNILEQNETPFYLFAAAPVAWALDDLRVLKADLPIRHWYSFKTAPIAPLIRMWKQLGQGVEVVSDSELRAALFEGFAIDNILVNGLAKHTWLSQHKIRRLRVHFDSLQEIRGLILTAVSQEWRVGMRIAVSGKYPLDRGDRSSTQFGLTAEEAAEAVDVFSSKGLHVESLHFHLGTNIDSPRVYKAALDKIRALSRNLKLRPKFIDCGGGLPVTGEWPPIGTEHRSSFRLHQFRQVMRAVRQHFPSAREIWMENGRLLLARAGVLVLRVCDIKDRADCRYLICDGGRTNHALGSCGELHRFAVHPRRMGRTALTTVCGPTCMVSDRLMEARLPKSIQRGDYLIWMNTGAYHVPFETRFSQGFAKVLWCDENGSITVAREREDFLHFWGQWRKT